MMAEAALDIEETEGEAEAQPVSMLDIMKAQNIVPMISEADARKIGDTAVQEYQIDVDSRKDWLALYDRAMDKAMQVEKEKTFPWRNASNVKFPVLTQAAIQFQARAYPAIIDGSNLVKGRVLGPDPEGKKRARADRVAQHMTWQLLYDMPGWEEDTDRLLLRLPIIGCVFRKSWQDPLHKKPMTETVSAKDFVVNYHATSLEKCPRYTHVQRYYPHEIEEYIRAGVWERVSYEGEDGQDPNSLVEFLEQHRMIDMDGDGYPEPYVVTLTKEGDVARIAPCFDMEGIYVSTDDGPQQLAELIESGAIPESIDIVKIERKEYFTKYGFIPSPDGSFYDIGFGFLLDNISASIDTIINQLIDAGTLSNMQGGFLGGGVKIKGGNMRFTPGEWKRVEGVSAGPLRDNILPLQLPGPSPVLFQLLGMLIEAAKDITSVQDILTGSQDSQTAPTTALALIEQGQKVFTAIYKRIHRAFGRELRILFNLNRDFLDEQTYYALADVPDGTGDIGRADYQDRDLDIVPVSDPTAVNDMQKMAKSQVLMQHIGDPLINQAEIRRRQFEAAGISDIPVLFEVPQQQPDPKMVSDTEKNLADIRAKDADTAEKYVSAAKTAFELGQQLGDRAMQKMAIQWVIQAQQLSDKVMGNEPSGEPGGNGAVEGASGDAGVPGVPEGPAIAAGDVMGGGEPDGSGGPIASGDLGGLVPA